MQEPKESNIISTIFYYIFLIIIAPIAVFFGAKIVILDGLFGISSVASNVWSAVVAVVLLHVIVGMYIYRAYCEPAVKAKPDKLD